MHALVADRLDDDLLASARERVERWLADSGPVRPPAAASWQEILSLPRSEIAARLTEDSEQMRDLRQNTPFAGAVEPRERWRIISEIA